MDQHSESGESPLCDPQSAGKTRKGFKLFGKRKPGSGVASIFSMRSKGDGSNQNKSSIARSNTQDGLGETVAQEDDQEPQKHQDPQEEVSDRDEQEKAGEVDDISGYDDTSCSVPPRPSISSVTSAKSLGFLSLLRGGRRGDRDRHAHTVSQPSMKQRRGIKGLFGSVPWHQRDKEPKEQSPPSPLLMTSRTNSVEIIKEDLTLTPKTPPRMMNSPEQELDTADIRRSDPDQTLASEDTCGSNLDVLEMHTPHVPTTEPALDPAEDRLSSLMADISLLISFDSFTGCGDIIADVEAEWGKASSAAVGVGTRADAGAKPSSTPSTFAPASKTLTPTTKSYMSSVPSTNLTPHSISPVLSSSSSPILSTNIKSNLMSMSNLTPNSTSSPTPHPVSTSTSICSSFTSTASVTSSPVAPPISAASKPSPVAPPISVVSEPSPVAPPISAVSKPSPVAPPISAVSKPSPVAPPISAVSEPSPVAPPISAVSEPSPVAPPISAVSKPSPVAPPISAVSKPSPVAPPISAVSEPSPVAPPISAVSKPSPVAPPISAVSKPSPVAPPISAVSEPSPVAPPISAVSEPSPVAPPISAVSKPSPVAPPISAVSKPSPVAPPISAVSKPSPVAPPISAVSEPSPVAPPISAVSKPSSEASALAASAKPTTVSQSPSPAAFASYTISSKQDSTEANSLQTFSHATTFKSSVGPIYPHTLSSIPGLPPSPDPDRGQTLSPASVQSPSPTLIKLLKSPSSNSVSAPKSNIDFSPPQTPPPPPTAPAIDSAPKPPEKETSGNGGKNATTPNGMDVAGTKTSKQEDQQGASLDGCLDVPQSDIKTPPKKTPGLSKIPVVGGGRPAKLPARKAMPSDDEECWDVPTHRHEEQSPQLSQQRMESRDSLGDQSTDMEVNLPTVGKFSPEENPLQLPKTAASLSRDSKIPVKHGVSTHGPPSQIPVTKEPHRTKIPVSKVPVRRPGCNKTTATSPKPVTEQLRK